MGAGIAAVAALAGDDVALIEPDAASRERARGLIARAAGESAGKVQYYETIPVGLQADFALEAVTERLDVKRAVFADLAKAFGPQALLATNTSSLSVSEIAEGVENPERVLGLHFFNPPGA